MDDSRCPQNTAVLYGSTPLTLRDLCRGSCVRVRDFVYMIRLGWTGVSSVFRSL